MRKIIPTIGLLLTLMQFACGGSGTTPTTPSTPTTPPPTTPPPTTPPPTTPTPPPPAAPSAPTGLEAIAGNAQIALTWSATADATSYVLERSTTSGGPYTQISTPSSSSYTDTGVVNGTTYYYVVIAVNSAGQSAPSAEVSATPDLALTAPSAPTGLSAAPGNAQVGLKWTVSTGASSYHVKRATVSAGPYAVIATQTPASFIDTALANGTTYYYVVSATNSAGGSGNSSQVSAMPAIRCSPTP
jgi:fibronectin type 3 domain-containing protein